MGALSSSSSEVAKWVPEDDILLKNAIEAGASLEALAKGAVNFTRRFSLKELQERWRALLYDSEVSSEASARMIEYESSTLSNPSIKPNPNPNPSPNPYKRTADSVRSRYYSMRKRVCTYQPAETAVENDLQLEDILPFLSDQSGGGAEFDPQPDYADSLLMSPKICPNIEDREDLEMAESDGDGKSGCDPISRDPDPIWQSIQREEQQEALSQVKEARSSSDINDGYIFSPMDFEIFMNEGEIADTSCSMFLNYPQDEVANQTGGPVADLPATESTCADGNNVINTVCSSVPAEVIPLEEKFMVCVLNTESWDIPNNSHLNFDDVSTNPNPNPSLNPNDSVNKHNLDMVASSAMPLTDGRPTTGGLIGMKSMDPVTPSPSLIPVPTSLEPLRTMGPSVLPQKVPMVHPSNVIRQNSTASNELNPALNNVTVPQDMGNREIYEKLNKAELDQAVNQMDYYSNTVNLPMGGKFDVPENCEPSTQAGMIVVVGEHNISGLGPSPGPGLDLTTASASDHEEQKASEESDNEVPSFSDIEAMILDMDLSPFDQENHLAKEVTRFHCAESRKSLMRLEQGASSYMNRSILSRGAFAVFYGRNLKYFIKSPEVSIGRETEDVKVDIDLGKEGHANKISRRQAVIKMDESGSFHIKNIGKCPLFVNSKEVPAKKRINLTSNSLIEVFFSLPLFRSFDQIQFWIFLGYYWLFRLSLGLFEF
ncbi:forkhead-associated (FHA) domain-containing protein isoform X2 [Carex rostrata]